MTSLRTITAAALLAVFAASAFAQASAPQPGGPPGPGASGPRMGMGPGMGGPGMGGGMGPRAGAGVTPGWSMMTPQEREQHYKDMQAAKTPEECKAVRDKHREQMVARAKERGASAPGSGPDVCAGMR